MVLNTLNEFLICIFKKEKFLHQVMMYEVFSSNKTRVLYCFIGRIKNNKTDSFLVGYRFGFCFELTSKIHNNSLVCWILTNKVFLESLECLLSENIYFGYLFLSVALRKFENSKTGTFCFPESEYHFVLIITFKP